MAELKYDCGAYLKAVLVESKRWIFTLFEILGIVLLLFPNLAETIESDGLRARVLGAAIFLTSFVIANFSAYRDLLRQSRKMPADIKLKLQSFSFGWSGWQGSMPISPLRFRIYLDIQNTGNEPGKLKSVSVSQFQMSTSLLGNQPEKLSWHKESDDPHQAGRKIVFPCLIEPGEWNVRIRCDLQVELCETDPMELAKRLCELDEFLIELHYEYEEFDGICRQKTLPIRDTFSRFRKHIIQEWRSHDCHELVYVAVGIESLLETGP
jgi:hypothetical protein